MYWSVLRERLQRGLRLPNDVPSPSISSTFGTFALTSPETIGRDNTVVEAPLSKGCKKDIIFGLAAIMTPGNPESTGGNGVKTFVPLENNPNVMSHLASLLGADSALTFHDVYTLDDPLFLAQIPRPVHALLFLCPASVYARARGAEDATMSEYTGSGEKEPVIWFRQTIRHACGLIGLLHALCNGDNRHHIKPQSLLHGILQAAIPLKPDARAGVLYNSSALEVAHAEAAKKGDTATPLSLDEEFHHFITFVKGSDGHLWELNGGMKGPVDRGVLAEGEDALSDRALDLGVRTILQQAEGGEHGFSIVAISEETI